jgi:hypothetical protein
MTTFFSVDVETTSTNPFDGHLLSVGIQPVTFNPATLNASLLPDKFYVRIDCYRDLEIEGWFDGTSNSPTYQWWMEQNAEARADSWENTALVRHSAATAAAMMQEWVCEVEPNSRDAIFVANPVSFDKPWVDRLCSETGIISPFHYQSLCLRSMKFGLRHGSAWVSTRDNHDPKIPHHAFHDAYAQALDLLAMLNERDFSEVLNAA